MNEIVPRYEFRLFGTCLGMAEQRLRALAPCESISESREVYLLDGDRVHEMNVKIRRGKLELKRLIDRHRGLERWRPAGQWAFPVAADTLRYRIEHGGMTWEIDEFLGENAGLVVAEIELETTQQSFDKPAWIGEEVTTDPRFFNANLVTSPYTTWEKPPASG